jgi:hypothetical protein
MVKREDSLDEAVNWEWGDTGSLVMDTEHPGEQDGLKQGNPEVVG